ncbi:MAG: YfhO family protein [Cyclobacteriaceae bacterium]|nr:YfhO family protein [Cyclobacteriaceae bacterium]
MKKLNFTQHVLPHLIAVLIFLIVTVFFFGPVFFENKSINQQDITQSVGAAKALRDFRDKTGEEGLWAPNMFSGMPAYLVNVEWGYQAITGLKIALALGLPHPVRNIFLAFLCYYILLLAFRVKPYLAIAGAIAFGLSSYMIVGLAAGHNARIGAIAFMPLVMAGIHLTFTGKRILGFGLTTAALALHLRENHLQITYYLALIVLGYGLVQLIYAVREKKVVALVKNVALLIPAALLAVGSFFGPLWSISEYSKYSIRGKSELSKPGTLPTDGLRKDYAFEYSNGILEPMTLFIPNFYGGSSMQNVFADEGSAVRKALNAQGIQYNPQQMAHPAYWGPQSLSAPYYSGAIIFFLFIVGIIFSERKYVWWMIPLSVIAIMLTWGSNFAGFNYFMFDYLPGYNKFRSVTFAIVITLFAMPLLGLTGLQRLMDAGLTKDNKKKLLIALSASGGLCLVLLLTAGMFSFLKDGESGLPAWFVNALRDERRSLLRADAFRSLTFISGAFILIYFEVFKKLPSAFYGVLIFFVLMDVAVVDKRYFTKDNYQRKSKNSGIQLSAGDQQVMADKSYFRVMNINGPMSDALTSYYHNSIGGYHGAKLKRYQDLYDSCITKEFTSFISEAQQGRFDFSKYPVLNMLNTKYIMYGQNRENVITNLEANGSAWFVQEVVPVSSPNEEIQKICGINSKTQAVIDVSKFTITGLTPDSTATIQLIENTPNHMTYEATTHTNGLAVFSEVYYPVGWSATIDGSEASIIRANFVLRALEIPAGKHTIEFKFAPKSFTAGNPITTVSSWLVLLVLLGSIGWSWRKES